MLKYRILNAKFEEDKSSFRYQREGSRDIFSIVSTAKPQPELVEAYREVTKQITSVTKNELGVKFTDVMNIHNVYLLDSLTVTHEESKIDRSPILAVQYSGRIHNTARKADFKLVFPKLYETELFLNMPKEYLLPIDLLNATYDLFSEICDYLDGARAQQVLFPENDDEDGMETLKEMVRDGSLKIETISAGSK